MLAPPEVLDAIVVHELCHRKVMNHSEKFYREIYRVFPEYDHWNTWLRKHGRELLRRNPG
jgi:predicted metal-dependent hydrolase